MLFLALRVSMVAAMDGHLGMVNVVHIPVYAQGTCCTLIDLRVTVYTEWQ